MVILHDVAGICHYIFESIWYLLLHQLISHDNKTSVLVRERIRQILLCVIAITCFIMYSTNRVEYIMKQFSVRNQGKCSCTSCAQIGTVDLSITYNVPKELIPYALHSCKYVHSYIFKTWCNIVFYPILENVGAILTCLSCTAWCHLLHGVCLHEH